MADGRCSGVAKGRGDNDLILLQCANDSTFATLLDLGLAGEIGAGRDWHLVGSENVDMTSRITDICHEKVNWWNWSDFQAPTRNGFKKFMSEDKPSWQGERQRIYDWLTTVRVNIWGNCLGVDSLHAFREMIQMARSCDNTDVKAWLAAVIDGLKAIPNDSKDMGWAVVEAFAAKELEHEKMKAAMGVLKNVGFSQVVQFGYYVLKGNTDLREKNWLTLKTDNLTPQQKKIYEKFKEMYEAQERDRATAEPVAPRPRRRPRGPAKPRAEEPRRTVPRKSNPVPDPWE